MQRKLYYILLPILVLIFYAVWYTFFRNRGKKFDEVSSLGSSLTDFQAKTISDVSYHAMHGYGTDEATLFNTLLILDEPSFKHVYNKFGIKEGMNLITWLSTELSVSDFKRFRDKYTIVP